MEIPSFIPTPDIFQARKVLAIQPHYDDNDIGAGGTLARLHDAGAEIIYLTVSDDLVGVTDLLLSDEQAAARLERDQRAAGAIIGVSQQIGLGYPDAGRYDYFDLRRDLIKHIRRLRPDFIFTVDPWLPYEAHHDHIQTGLATAEAAALFNLLRLPSDPQVDAAFQPYGLAGVAFYYTRSPNVPVDITATQARKHAAIQCYETQINGESAVQLLNLIEAMEGAFGAGQGYAYAEALRVMAPQRLHCGA
ncbi:MAG: PIG-L family deacetylase [Chloroflexi bacterium]|nr:PIG-L family deacetylase [Chloroflexota bacterium]